MNTTRSGLLMGNLLGCMNQLEVCGGKKSAFFLPICLPSSRIQNVNPKMEL